MKRNRFRYLLIFVLIIGIFVVFIHKKKIYAGKKKWKVQVDCQIVQWNMVSGWPKDFESWTRSKQVAINRNRRKAKKACKAYDRGRHCTLISSAQKVKKKGRKTLWRSKYKCTIYGIKNRNGWPKTYRTTTRTKVWAKRNAEKYAKKNCSNYRSSEGTKHISGIRVYYIYQPKRDR